MRPTGHLTCLPPSVPLRVIRFQSFCSISPHFPMGFRCVSRPPRHLRQRHLSHFRLRIHSLVKEHMGRGIESSPPGPLPHFQSNRQSSNATSLHFTLPLMGLLCVSRPLRHVGSATFLTSTSVSRVSSENSWEEVSNLHLQGHF